MSINIIYPTIEKPYVLPTEPIILRVACAAGINRSAVVRQLLIDKIHVDSRVYPQFGAYRGDFNENNKYICGYYLDTRDGFYDVFGVNKTANLQSIIFQKLGYEKPIDNISREALAIRQFLEHNDVSQYQDYLEKFYWRTGHIEGFGIEFDTSVERNKNVFVLVNEYGETRNLVIKRLIEAEENVDLVILSIPDTIENPESDDVEPQSKKAYQLFIDKISGYFAAGGYFA